MENLSVLGMALIGAGAVVRGDVPDYALMLGVPARQHGWMSRHGHHLSKPDPDGIMICQESGWRYREVEPGVLRCLDWPEDKPLLPFSLTGQKGMEGSNERSGCVRGAEGTVNRRATIAAGSA